MLRTLELNPDMAADFADAIKGRDLATLVDIMPSLQFNQFAGLLDEQNAGSLSEIAKAWASGEKRKIDRVITEQTLDIARTKRQFAIFARDKNAKEMRLMIKELRRDTSYFSNVPVKYQNMMAEFESQYDAVVSDQKKTQFGVDSTTLVNNTDSENIQSNLDALYESAKKLDADPELVVASVQEMLNLAASDAVNDYIVDRFDVSQVSAEQLKYMSLYAETGERVTGLLPESRKFVDMVMARDENLYGQTVKVQSSYLAEQLNSLSGQMKETLNVSEQEKARVQFKFNIVNGQAVQNPESEDVQAAAQEVMADVVGLNEFPPDLYTMSLDEIAQRPELAALLAMSKEAKVVTSAFVSTADKFLRDGLTPEQIPEFMRNVRELVLTDSRGRIGLNDSARAALGGEKATQLQVMYTAYNVAPIGSEGAFMSRVLERLNDPLTNDEFTRVTGYRDRATLLLEADVPRNLWDEYAPVVDALGIMRGKNAAADMKKYIDARLHENNNAYDLFTGSSAVSFDIEALHGNVKAVDLGIQKIVSEFSTEQEPLHYEVESKVSVDDITAAVADDGYIISAPSVSDAMTQLRVRKRVIYGPRADFSLSNPVMQLYKVDEFGMVTVIDGSSFNIMTDERILEEVKKAPKYIKADPTRLQGMDELEGDVDAYLSQFGIGVNVTGGGASPLANTMRITVDGTENQ